MSVDLFRRRRYADDAMVGDDATITMMVMMMRAMTMRDDVVSWWCMRLWVIVRCPMSMGASGYPML